MILKALYDYYDRCGTLPARGTAERELQFILVLSPFGEFLRVEDCRSADKKSGRTFIVARPSQHIGNVVSPLHLFDNLEYVLGYSASSTARTQKCHNSFIDHVRGVAQKHPENGDMRALMAFYAKPATEVLTAVQADPLWEEMARPNVAVSFRIDGDLEILAEKSELMSTDAGNVVENMECTCLVTGAHCHPIRLTTPTPIDGGTPYGRLVAFQKNEGYDSYGKVQGANAPISADAEFKYTTALLQLCKRKSRNCFQVGSRKAGTLRTFVFWSSSQSKASQELVGSLYSLCGFTEKMSDDPNFAIEQVQKSLRAIYSGSIPVASDERFYILGLAPNVTRIAVVYWQETTLREFAGKILQHFDDMRVDGANKTMRYAGLYAMLAAVAVKAKTKEKKGTEKGKTTTEKDIKIPPNLPEAVLQSIFQGTPYPFTLYAACLRRIGAEQHINITRAAILKAYLNRKHQNKLPVMLDTTNTNPAYLCGRLFATLDYMQERAIPDINRGIRERFIYAASATPTAVFPTVLKLSFHHAEKLSDGTRIFLENIKQEIIDKLPATGFPTRLDLNEQGRFLVGYYHQRQFFYTAKADKDQQTEK